MAYLGGAVSPAPQCRDEAMDARWSDRNQKRSRTDETDGINSENLAYPSRRFEYRYAVKMDD